MAGLTDLPLLRKDFITRDSQIVKSKEMGASAILLTARILPKSTFQSLIDRTLGHGLTPFVEIADHDELDSVIHPEECIIAINNKDIRTQEREAGRHRPQPLAAGGRDRHRHAVPGERERDPRPEGRRRAGHAGFKGLLIGTGLLRADSVKGFVDEFERHRAELREAVARPSATSGA